MSTIKQQSSPTPILNSLSSFFSSTPQGTLTDLNSSQSSDGLMGKIMKYGKVGIITHLTISWSILGLTYLIVSRTGQTAKLIKILRLEKKVPQKAGAFVIAGVIYKAIMPVRIGLSLMAIPIVIRTFDLHVQEQPKLSENTANSLLLLSEAGIPNYSVKDTAK